MKQAMYWDSPKNKMLIANLERPRTSHSGMIAIYGNPNTATIGSQEPPTNFASFYFSG